MTYRTTLVSGPEWIDRIAKFRIDVWSQADLVDVSFFPDGKWLDDVDADATHIVIVEDGELLAAVRYCQYPTIDSTHHGSYYREAGIDLDGPIGIPERMVVRQDLARKGLAWVLANAIAYQAVTQGARHVISECSEGTAALMRKRGRPSLGFAPYDPRFPNVRFEWMHSDIAVVLKELGEYAQAG